MKELTIKGFAQVVLSAARQYEDSDFKGMKARGELKDDEMIHVFLQEGKMSIYEKDMYYLPLIKQAAHDACVNAGVEELEIVVFELITKSWNEIIPWCHEILKENKNGG
jgi:hypothetical protein